MPYVYVVVCEDIPLHDRAVQACHASVAAGRDLVNVDSPHLVLLSVSNLAALVQLSATLTQRGVRHRVFLEDDLGGRATALATEVVSGEARKLFSNLKLYRPRGAAA